MGQWGAAPAHPPLRPQPPSSGSSGGLYAAQQHQQHPQQQTESGAGMIRQRQLSSSGAGDPASYGAAGVLLAGSVRDDEASGPGGGGGAGGGLGGAAHGTALTCLRPVGSPWDGRLVAGTADGRLRFIDVATCQLLEAWRCAPSGAEHPGLSGFAGGGDSGVLCVYSSPADGTGALGSASCVAAGLRSGYCSLLDSRVGGVVRLWAAHDAAVTCMAGYEAGGLSESRAACVRPLIITGSSDRTVSVWDVRMLSNASTGTRPLVTLVGHKARAPLAPCERVASLYKRRPVSTPSFCRIFSCACSDVPADFFADSTGSHRLPSDL